MHTGSSCLYKYQLKMCVLRLTVERTTKVRRVIGIIISLIGGLYFFLLIFAHGSVDSLYLESLRRATLMFFACVLLIMFSSNVKWPAICIGMPAICTMFLMAALTLGTGEWKYFLFDAVVYSAAIVLAIRLAGIISTRMKLFLTRRSTQTHK